MIGRDKSKPENQPPPKLRRVIEAAFPGDEAPPELSVAIVSLVELCQLAMPNPAGIAEAIQSAGFAEGPKERADEFAGWLALDNKVFSFPVRNLRHKLFARNRHDVRVRLLVSEGESAQGRVLFVTTIFGGALEADAIKAAAHVTKKQPLTGATVTNAEGKQLRRVFWDAEGESGIRGLMVTGPQDVESADAPRAFTAFNLVGKAR
jgi:hypothetical protein